MRANLLRYVFASACTLLHTCVKFTYYVKFTYVCKSVHVNSVSKYIESLETSKSGQKKKTCALYHMLHFCLSDLKPLFYSQVD